MSSAVGNDEASRVKGVNIRWSSVVIVGDEVDNVALESGELDRKLALMIGMIVDGVSRHV